MYECFACICTLCMSLGTLETEEDIRSSGNEGTDSMQITLASKCSEPEFSVKLLSSLNYWISPAPTSIFSIMKITRKIFMKL